MPFTDEEHQYFKYQARQEYLRIERTVQRELEEAKEREVAALQREALALQEKDAVLEREAAALADVERLKALLNQQSH